MIPLTIPYLPARGSSFHRIIMPLKAFFDDSGHYQKPSETACIVGGFIATDKEWDIVEPKWWKVIHSYGVSEFKASALQCFDGEYKKWDETKRRAFLQELVAVLRDHFVNPSKPIAAMLPKQQFSDLTQDERDQWGGDPYFVCLQDVLESATIHAQELYESREKVVVKCDQESLKFMNTAQNVYLACRDHLPAGSLLSEFDFGKSHDIAGLQVADFVAYYALQLRRDMLEGQDNIIDKPWWLMEQLLALYNPEFEYFIAPQLWEREPLTNYSLTR